MIEINIGYDIYLVFSLAQACSHAIICRRVEVLVAAGVGWDDDDVIIANFGDCSN